MRISLIVTIFANSALFFDNLILWYIGMAVMGISASLYIIAWSTLFSLLVEPKDHMRTITAVMLLANIILTAFHVSSEILHEKAALFMIFIPLAASLYILTSRYFKIKDLQIKPHAKLPVPKSLLSVFMLIVFIIYLNGGFMYRVMLPALTLNNPYTAYYPFAIYISVLFLIYLRKKPFNRALLIYPGISFIGLAFISFILIGQSGFGFLLTVGLMESSFALLDVFLWITLGSLAYIYGSPYIIFGMMLGANTSGILFGDLAGENILSRGNDPHLLTTLISSATILITVAAIPWIMKSVEQKLVLIREADIKVVKDSPVDSLTGYLLPGKTLTGREVQVLSLILEGMTNKDIALTLYISEHTVKTHVKNISAKFGVSRKKDLLHLASRTRKS